MWFNVIQIRFTAQRLIRSTASAVVMLAKFVNFRATKMVTPDLPKAYDGKFGQFSS